MVTQVFKCEYSLGHKNINFELTHSTIQKDKLKKVNQNHNNMKYEK